jgi:hypothetical protein
MANTAVTAITFRALDSFFITHQNEDRPVVPPADFQERRGYGTCNPAEGYTLPLEIC